MARPTKIQVVKKQDGYEITCIDEMTGSATGMDVPIEGYEALKHHFKTGAMEVSSDELAALPICGVMPRFSDDEDEEEFEEQEPDYYTCMCCGNVQERGMSCNKCAGPTTESFY